MKKRNCLKSFRIYLFMGDMHFTAALISVCFAMHSLLSLRIHSRLSLSLSFSVSCNALSLSILLCNLLSLYTPLLLTFYSLLLCTLSHSLSFALHSLNFFQSTLLSVLLYTPPLSLLSLALSLFFLLSKKRMKCKKL